MCSDMTGFEKILTEQTCAIIDIPADRWRKDDFYHPDPNQKGHHVIPKMAFCESFYDFDAAYFNLSPRECNFIDPQHRQSMVTTEQALQDAGYTRQTVPKDTGVFVGMGIIDFPGVLTENRFFYNGQTWAGFAHSCAANRVSNFYGFTGPSCAVDTACAASLTAVHVGCMALWNKECSMSISGASSNLYSPETTVAFSQLGVLSSTGNSAPFDHTNNGYVRGEGTGMVVLKPLDQALKDGDHIYCAIRATTSAHNGNSNSLTLPSATAQQELINRCYNTFDIPLSTVDFVEAHGTGTPVGDPLETKALGSTFGAARPKSDPMPIASAKSSFGHLEVCAGMVQIVKAALMLEKRMIYKQKNWEAPNPRIDFEELNLVMQLKEEAFTKDKKFVIGVNTFGFGGSLVHMVFEETVQKQKALTDMTPAGWKFGPESTEKGRKIAIPISAKGKTALRNSVAAWVAWENCLDHDSQATVSWLATRREHYMGRRLVVLAESGADFSSKLNGWLEGKSNPDVMTGLVDVPYEKPKICFVFSGFTQQHFDMGRGLYKNEPTFRRTVDECDAIFKTQTGYSALEKYKIFVEDTTGADPADINKAACKPGILFLQIGLHRLFESWGVKADMVMGVGLGELSAAFACGAISVENAIRCMVIRMAAPAKEDFLKTMKTVLNGPKPKTATFLSTITGEQHQGPLDADYWWKNVAAEKNINGALESVALADKNTIFIEMSAKPVLAGKIQEVTESAVHTTGVEGECDWVTTQRVMAEVHNTGYEVNWRSITRDCPMYSQIPMYGFDETRYKLETQEYYYRRMGLRDRSFKAVGGVLSHHEHFHLSHYTMGEDTVVPAASHTEYMLEYVEDEKAPLKNIKFPVKFEDQLIVPPLERDGHVQEAHLKVRLGRGTMTTHDLNGKDYASAEITSARTATETPTVDIKAAKARCPGVVDPGLVYERYAKLGLTYGESYRLMSEVNHGDGEALGLFNSPHPKNRFERIESVVLDSAFQLAIGCFTRGSGLYMPSEIGLIQMFIKKVTPVTPFVVLATLQDWSLESITCNLTIADREGKVWATIEGFKAASTIKSKTDVDYNDLVYATKYEFMASCLPSLSHAEKLTVDDDNAESCITPIISAYARQAVATTNAESIPEKCKPVLANLKSLASLDNSQVDPEAAVQKVLDDYPAIGTEVEMVKAVASSLPDMLADPEKASTVLTGDAFENLLSNSTLKATYERTSALLNNAIDEAFSSGHMKHVVRVCEIGGQNIAFSKELIKGLSDKVKQGNVEYIYTDKTSEKFSTLAEEFANLPTIKYETYDPLEEEESSVKFAARSYDIVIYNDFPTLPEDGALAAMRNLLTENGWFVMLRPDPTSTLYQFISGSEVVPDVEKKINQNGLEETRILNSPQPAIASVVVAKRTGAPTKPLTGDRWVILTRTKSPVVDLLTPQLPGEKHVFTTQEMTDVLAAVDSEKKTNLIYFVGGDDTAITSTIQLIDGLSDLSPP